MIIKDKEERKNRTLLFVTKDLQTFSQLWGIGKILFTKIKLPLIPFGS